MYTIYEKLLKDRGISNYKVAKDTGITQTTLSDWKKGKITPKTETLTKIADYLNVSVEYLLGRVKDKHSFTKNADGSFTVGLPISEAQSFVKDMFNVNSGFIMPVLGRVQAGIPIEAVEDIVGEIVVTEGMALSGEYFALKVKGDSMEPRLIEGDVVIVKKQPDIESGEIGIVMVNGSDSTIKKVVKHDNGISLIAFNQTYTPRFYTSNEIEMMPVEILGKVVEIRGIV